MRELLLPTAELHAHTFREEHVLEIQEAMADGETFSPITVRRAGRGWRVVDGNHRLKAAQRLGLRTIRAVVFS